MSLVKNNSAVFQLAPSVTSQGIAAHKQNYLFVAITNILVFLLFYLLMMSDLDVVENACKDSRVSQSHSVSLLRGHAQRRARCRKTFVELSTRKVTEIAEERQE